MIKGFRDSTKALAEVLLKETVHQYYHSSRPLGRQSAGLCGALAWFAGTAYVGPRNLARRIY